ncbi:MAG TPA: pitrilysin family protein [Bryobacteraceae bacterium]|nr:pitrilysin family protein [Bryobacteraceae bacterium]
MRTRLALIAILMCAAAFADVKLPPYTRQVLPNGVVVDLMPRAGVPLVSFRILVRGGAEAEPASLAGLASVTAQLLRKGTARRTADQFSEELDFLGGSFQTPETTQSPATVVTGEFLKKDFDRGLDLVSDAVLHAAFPEAEVRKTLAQRIDAAKAAKDQPQAAIGLYFAAFFFGPAHPYGRPPDERSLARIQRQDIADFHARTFCGKNLIVIVTGDFDPASAAAKVRDAFGGVAAGAVFESAKTASAAPGARLLLVDKPDATQTYFYIGEPGIDRRNPDRVKLILVNLLVGGRFTSLLNEELRVKSGLTYGATSIVQQPRLPGAILIASFTRTDSTEKALDVTLDVLKRLGAAGITADQLASAKAYLKGTYPPQRLETSDQVAAALGDLEVYGLGRDDIDDLFARIDAVTLEQANAIVRKYYKADNLTFVLLGNAAKIRDSARKFEPKVTEVAITRPGFLAE